MFCFALTTRLRSRLRLPFAIYRYIATRCCTSLPINSLSTRQKVFIRTCVCVCARVCRCQTESGIQCLYAVVIIYAHENLPRFDQVNNNDSDVVSIIDLTMSRTETNPNSYQSSIAWILIFQPFTFAAMTFYLNFISCCVTMQIFLDRPVQLWW